MEKLSENFRKFGIVNIDGSLAVSKKLSIAFFLMERNYGTKLRVGTMQNFEAKANNHPGSKTCTINSEMFHMLQYNRIEHCLNRLKFKQYSTIKILHEIKR